MTEMTAPAEARESAVSMFRRLLTVRSREDLRRVYQSSQPVRQCNDNAVPR